MSEQPELEWIEEPSAVIAKRNGWGVGTILTRPEHVPPHKPFYVRITAIGEEEVLVRIVAAQGYQIRDAWPERIEALQFSDWTEVQESDLPPVGRF